MVPINYPQRLPSIIRRFQIPVEQLIIFATFFLSILGSTVAKKISSSIKTYRSFLPDRLINSFFFEFATQGKIVEIAKTLRLNTEASHTLTIR